MKTHVLIEQIEIVSGRGIIILKIRKIHSITIVLSAIAP